MPNKYFYRLPTVLLIREQQGLEFIYITWIVIEVQSEPEFFSL